MAAEKQTKVKLAKNARDARTNRVYHAGDEVEVSEETAERFRKAGVVEGEAAEAREVPKEAEQREAQTTATKGGESSAGTEAHPSVRAAKKTEEK